MIIAWTDSLFQSPVAAIALGLALVFVIGIVLAVRRWTRAEPASSRPSASEARPLPEASAPPEPELAPMEMEAEPAESSRYGIEPEPQAMEAEAPPIGREQEDHYVVTVHYGTDREDTGASRGDRFSDNRARPPRGTSPITYGSCNVSIPKIHSVGKLEAPGWFESEQPGRHIMLLSLTTANRQDFLNNLDAAMRDDKQAFVFVHGFSVSFEDAARRTAQMAFDLKFPGVPIFYSWPTEVLGFTNPDPTAYSEAENNARWATEHFRTFLLDIVRSTEAKTVHLIAHSMGNRIVTDALMQLFWILTDEEKETLGEVILTAPDIDADVFTDQIAPRITAMNSRVTLYASSRDKALAQSKRVHGYPRAGDFAAFSFMPEKVEIVDASDVDTDSFGHSYYGNAQSVISDICHLVVGRNPAADRVLTLLSHSSAQGEPFWRVRKDTTLETVWAKLTELGSGPRRLS